MNSIQKKKVANYWLKKIKNTSVYNEQRFDVISSDLCKIERSELNYFYKISQNNPIANFTLFAAVYSALVQRYFDTKELIYAEGSVLKHPVLFNSISTDDKTLKLFFGAFKKELQEIYRHIDFPNNFLQEYSIENYAQFGLYYNTNNKSIHNSPFPFSLMIDENEKALTFQIAFNENFSSKAVANHFLNNFRKWFIHLEYQMNEVVNELPIVDETERAILLESINTTGAQVIEDKTLIDLFEAQVSRTPMAIAIIFGDTEITYADLNKRANQLANYLGNKHNIQRKDFVGVKLKRSENLVVAILAVLKLGATYVPVDINYPEERIAYIEEDSNSKCVIDDNLLDDFNKHLNNFDQSNLKIERSTDDIAYIIYTSGTTGNPKGVMITHQNASAMIQWAWKEYKAADFDIVYAPTSHCFDLSIYEMFYPLSIGKKVKILESALEIGEALSKDKNVLLNLVPSSMRNILEAGYNLENVNFVNLAGEPFPVDIAHELLKVVPEVRNLYGPSEDTTYSTCYKLSAGKAYKTIPIGKPITNTKVYVLDKHLQLLPTGVVGKLYISGHGLTKGYLNKAELTAEKYIENPFLEGEKMYDTGDLVKWMPDGNLEFLGRKDHQVKLRGYRIELEEIENAITGFSTNLKQAVVTVKQMKGTSVLAVYFVSDDSNIDQSVLRDFLEEKLPGYMVPEYFIPIPKIPLTPNGKIDKRALPEIDTSVITKKDYIAPIDEIEKKLVEIWEDVLGMKVIGVNNRFFDLGGHSLMISRIINAINKELQLNVSHKTFFKNPTIKDLKDNLQHPEITEIPKANEANDYPLTSSQKRLWLLNQLDNNNSTYLIASAFEIEGNIDVDCLENSFRKIIDRHEILRTGFTINAEGEVRQKVLEDLEMPFQLDVLDYRKQKNPNNSIEKYINKKAKNKIDLSRPPLLQGTLFRIDENKNVLFFSIHHLISDAWSLEFLINEVAQLYNGLKAGKESNLPDLPIQYKDYTLWLNKQKKQKGYKESESYWLNKFKGEIPVLNLPGFRIRPTLKSYNGDNFECSYSIDFLQKLKSFAASHGTTLFTVLMAGVNGLIHRYTKQDDIIIGVPIAGRNIPVLENQIGLYLNTLAVRTSLKNDASFSDIVAAQKQTLLEAYEHQQYAFDQLVDQLKLERDSSRSPLFDVLVNMPGQHHQKAIDKRVLFEGLEWKDFSYKRGTVQFDWEFTFSEGNGLNLAIDFNTDIYDGSFIERICFHFENFLNQAIDKNDVAIQKIDYLTAHEKEQLIIKNNPIPSKRGQNKTIIELFENQVEQTPDNCALVFEDKKISYKQLNETVNQMAFYLRKSFDIRPDELVGVMLPRSEKLIITILGILKSGGAYVPIDSQFPEERKTFIKKDSACKIVLDEKEFAHFLKHKNEYSKNNLPLLNTSQNLAYVMYTSGTTGVPKGVMVEHGNVVRLVKPLDYFPLNESNDLLSTGAVSFDATILEYFGTLLNGSKLVLASQENLLELKSLARTIAKNQVNSLWMTSSWFNQVVEEKIELFKPIKQLIVGGDIVSPKHVSQLYKKYPSIRIVNGYGPTENTTFSTTYTIRKKPYTIIPIGKAISNSSVYILDENLNVVPEGISGKIFVGGSGVARGYLNDSELTKKKFFQNPYNEAERIYDTGDLGRWLPDGNIEFLGRKDSQVKIRGYRIELESIEKNILEFSSAIQQALVLVKEEKGRKIIAAYYSSSKALNNTELRLYLEENLPSYMIPTYYIALAQFPLTRNGKIDRAALPKIDKTAVIKKSYLAPGSKEEKEVAIIWQEVIGIDRVGVNDNFFQLGGHSLLISKVINKIQKKLNKTVSYNDFFSNPTVRGLCNNLKAETFDHIAKAPKANSYALTPSQNRLWILSQLEGGKLAYNIPVALELKGSLNKDLLSESFKNVIERHEILRTAFKLNLDGIVHQFVQPVDAISFNVGYHDFSKRKRKQAVLNDFLDQKSEAIFDFNAAPLLRADVVKLESKKHILFFSMHHIIGDARSLEVLIREVVLNYQALEKQDPIILPELPIQFKDYSEWMNGVLSNDSYKTAEGYWLRKFEGELPVLNLPAYKVRPAIQTFKGDRIIKPFSKKLLNNLLEKSKDLEASLFMILMAGVNVLLHKYTQQNDIVIGTPVSGRAHEDLNDLIGLFLNTQAIRTKLNPQSSIGDFIKNQKETLSNAYDHQHYPFSELVNRLKLKRDTSRSALFDVMVNMPNQQPYNFQVLSSNDLQISHYEFNRKQAQVDLNFIFRTFEDFELLIEYNTDIYDAVLIERMFLHLEQILWQFVEKPELNISAINCLTKGEKKELLGAFNKTKKAYPKTKTVLDQILKQVNKHPEKQAIFDDLNSYSYKEINDLSNTVAYNINKLSTVDEKSPVGILVPRSAKMIIIILGIIKSGRPYIPLDPKFPAERLNYILKNSQTQLLISEHETNQNLEVEGLDVIEVKHLFEESGNNKLKHLPKISSSDAAYIIYTSGSTGNPKGVEIGHQSLLNLLCSMQQSPGFDEHDTMFSVTTYSFDISILEFFGPLISGGTVYVAGQNVLAEPQKIINTIELINPSIIQATPSFYQILFDSGWQGNKELKILCGGDLMSESLASKLIDHSLELWNMYGPTETTIWSSCKKVESPQDASIIGKPINNTQIYILDKEHNLVPKGTKGDLYISGDGLAKGYYNQEALTNRKFITNIFDEDKLMYAVGDVGFWNEDGEIKFLGRNDHQVKLRGYRIELGDIENAIALYSKELLQVVVLVKTLNNEKNLVAYYTSKSAVDHKELKSLLLSKLPAYMIPNVYLHLEAFPLTPNKKINRNALPKLSGKDMGVNTFVAPVNKKERQLSEIWTEVLGLEKVSTEDNFFELGGHSLIIAQVINRIKNKLGQQLSFQDFFKNPTIKEAAQKLNKLDYAPIPKVIKRNSYPLSAAQKRLWILSQLDEGLIAYNMPMAVKIEGAINKEIFKAAFDQLLARHEILRTAFRLNDSGEVNQFILPESEVTFSLEQLDYSKSENYQERIDDYVNEKNRAAFDLAKPPLIKGALIKIKKDVHIFYLSMHHLIGDGWSVEILIADVMKIYAALIKNENVNLPKLEIQYKDYVSWQQKQLDTEQYKAAEKYWLDTYQNEIPVLNIPSFKPRPKVQTFNGAFIKRRFPKELLLKLKKFAVDQEATLYMVLVAALNTLLNRYTNQNDIVLGMPIAGRSHIDLEHQIGLYLNTLAIRTEIEAGDSFSNLLERQKTILLEAYEHQNYPFDELVNKLNLKRDMSRSALFDVIVNMTTHDNLISIENNHRIDHVNISQYELKNDFSLFDLSFIFREKEALELEVQYNADIYESFQVERMFKHLENILDRIIENPKEKIRSIDYLTSTEKKHFSLTLNATEKAYPKEKTIVDIFEQQVGTTPYKVALLFEDKRVTFSELNVRINQFAHYLRNNYKIRPDDLVAIKLDRSEDLIITIFGILKAGAGYLPIDGKLPQPRINYIINDSQCKLVIDAKELALFLKQKDAYSKRNPIKINEPQSLAYTMYTSGTTGNPKGVMMEHRNVIRLAKPMDYFPLDLGKIILSTGAVSFDATIIEYFGALLNGGTLILTKQEHLLDLEKLAALINEYQVNSLFMTSSWFNQVVEEKIALFKPLKQMMVGGDIVSPKHVAMVQNLYPDLKITNGYGPTENTTLTTTFLIEKKPYTNIPIGKAISNSSVYILDENLALVPEGVVGKIYGGGDGVARGYINKEKLTKEKFVANPYREGDRIYDTGDLGRWLPEGQIEFLGRKDHQVKIRGYRIELAAIENTVLKYSKDLKQVIVLTREINNEKSLVVYLTAESTIGKEDLKTFLEEQLPFYMVPLYYIQLDEFPLTNNGKIDRSALPELEESNLIKRNYIAPINKREELLVVIWKDILNLDNISTTDNFFELGGHSLLLTKLINEYLKAFNVSVSLKQIYSSTTIKEHADLIASADHVQFDRIEAIKEKESYDLSPTQLRFWLIHKIRGKSKKFNIFNSFELPADLDVEAFTAAFHKLIDRHEILRTIFVDDREGLAKQKLVEPSGIEIVKYDALVKAKEQVFNHEFELNEFPLFKVGLVQEENQMSLLFNIHHIIGDGWSMNVALRDLMEMYYAQLEQRDHVLPVLDIQYKDYAHWQQSSFKNNLLSAQKEYWLKQLSGDLPYLQLPYDYHNKIKKENQSSAYYINYLKSDLKLKLEAIVGEHQVSLFSIFVSALNILLNRLTSINDLIIGIPVANRNHVQLKDVFGCFLNTVMLRNNVDREDLFLNFLKKVNDNLTEALSNQNYPFENVLKELGIPSDNDRFPFSSVFLNMVDFEAKSEQQLEDINPVHGSLNAPPKFDFECYIKSYSNAILINCVYDQHLFKKESIAYWIDEYISILEQVANNIQVPNKKIAVFETAKFISKDEYPTNEFELFEDSEVYQSIAERFEKQVAKTPDNIAVTDHKGAISYQDLNDITNHLARQIVGNSKIKGKRIALLLKT